MTVAAGIRRAVAEVPGLVALAVPIVLGLAAATLLGVTDTLMLAPLGPGGSWQYLARVHDLATDQPTHDQPRSAAGDAVVIVDGSFLQNERLDGLWDEVVYVDASFAAARERGIQRDAAVFGGVEEAGDLYDSRYHAAARRYLDEAHPAEQPFDLRLLVAAARLVMAQLLRRRLAEGKVDATARSQHSRAGRCGHHNEQHRRPSVAGMAGSFLAYH